MNKLFDEDEVVVDYNFIRIGGVSLKTSEIKTIVPSEYQPHWRRHALTALVGIGLIIIWLGDLRGNLLSGIVGSLLLIFFSYLNKNKPPKELRLTVSAGGLSALTFVTTDEDQMERFREAAEKAIAQEDGNTLQDAPIVSEEGATA